MKILTRIKNRKILLSIVITVAVIALIVGACAIYVSIYYRTDLEAVAAHAHTCEGYATVSFPDEKTVVLEPEGATKGFIFYPGGKVEFTAYLPLMAECAEQGILCVLVKMPCNLAVLDVNAADGIKEQYPEIEEWYIGGHSLGGSMAASYVADNFEDFDGLVLLGAYSTADLSDTSLKVLSIYGSEDGVMNREKYEKYSSNLPDSFTEYVIEGGCHAYFGMYGEQDGDGEASISNTEQISVTAQKIAKTMFEE